MKLLQNLKKDKKGFTLIEMIVVIVIIGILLAILVPGMFKYIDQAKDKQVEVDARAAYMSIETAVGTVYKSREASVTAIQTKLDGLVSSDGGLKSKETLIIGDGDSAVKAEISIPDKGVVTAVTLDENGGIKAMTYTWNEAKTMVMADGIWGEVKPVPKND